MSDEAVILTSDQPLRDGTVSTMTEHAWLPRTLLIIGRLGLAYLFFSQLFWKLPPTFGCPADFHFTTANANGTLARSDALCDWIGVESVWAQRPRSILGAGPVPGIPIGWAARINGVFIDHVVEPNIRWFGYLIWLSEAFIFVSLFFGILSRLGALVAICMSAQLLVGLAGITDPYEWEWSYIAILLLALVLFAIPAGRFFGLDALLRPRLSAAASRGNGIARFLLLLT